MKTDVITINSVIEGHDAAMQTADKFSAYNGISGKNAMHIRLLTEEMISMVHGILDDFRGDFWLESIQTKNGLLCRICLSADKYLNKEQESKILSVSTSGKNQSVKGVLGKIRELFRQSLQAESFEDEQFLTNMSDTLGYTGMSDTSYWSLQAYRQSISPKSKPEEWDELERSIIAKLADEVKVWLRSDATEIVIEKLITI